MTKQGLVHESLWRGFNVPRFPPKELPRQVDVVIVGGGITGLTAAHLLKKAGKHVALFDRERIGAGETGNTSAHLTYVTDLRLSELVRRFGEEAAQLVWRGGETALDVIETNVEECDISCGFRRVPGFVYASIHGDKDESDTLREESQAANDLGFAARFLKAGPIMSKPAVSYADQALFHPLAYLSGLARAVDGDGSVVREQCELGEVLNDPMVVVVNGENIACDYLIIATHVPLMGLTGLVSATLFQTKLYPYSSYVVGARVPRSTLQPGLYSDTSDPYYYLRIHEDQTGRYAVFGGEDHKTGQVEDTAACFTGVEKTLREIIPDAEVERRWSGQVIETSDGLPFMGETAERQFVSTGYSGNGLTFGTLGGIMAHDAVMKRSNPWQELFDPARKKMLSGLKTVISENIDYPVHFILDRLRQDRTSGADAVARGEGKVLTISGKPVACHRTATGQLIKVSAVCTHMGCLVRWNKGEQTWDCPCHGSRFTPDGLVLGGPAEEPLEKVER